MVDERDGAAVRARRVELAGKEGGDALAVEDAQFDGSGRDRLEAGGSRPRKARRMPRQVRNPCSGWGRLSSTALIKPSVFGPTLPAQRRNRSGVHSA